MVDLQADCLAEMMAGLMAGSTASWKVGSKAELVVESGVLQQLLGYFDQELYYFYNVVKSYQPILIESDLESLSSFFSRWRALPWYTFVG